MIVQQHQIDCVRSLGRAHSKKSRRFTNERTNERTTIQTEHPPNSRCFAEENTKIRLAKIRAKRQQYEEEEEDEKKKCWMWTKSKSKSTCKFVREPACQTTDEKHNRTIKLKIITTITVGFSWNTTNTQIPKRPRKSIAAKLFNWERATGRQIEREKNNKLFFYLCLFALFSIIIVFFFLLNGHFNSRSIFEWQNK